MSNLGVNIQLLEGKPRGIRSAYIEGQLIHAYALPVSQSETFIKEQNDILTRVGMYIFSSLASGENGVPKYSIYVGQSGNLIERLKYQVGRIPLSDLLVFFDDTNRLSEDDSRLLEWRFIKRTMQLNHNILNKAMPNIPEIPEHKNHLKQMAQSIELLTSVLGYQIFETPEFVTEQTEIEFYARGKGAEAKAKVVNQVFAVLRGSTAVPVETPTCPDNVIKLRTELTKEKILEMTESGLLIFTRDFSFSSPSTAASVVLGRSANGNLEWKTSDGVTFGTLRNDTAK